MVERVVLIRRRFALTGAVVGFGSAFMLSRIGALAVPFVLPAVALTVWATSRELRRRELSTFSVGFAAAVAAAAVVLR